PRNPGQPESQKVPIQFCTLRNGNPGRSIRGTRGYFDRPWLGSPLRLARSTGLWRTVGSGSQILAALCSIRGSGRVGVECGDQPEPSGVQAHSHTTAQPGPMGYTPTALDPH